MCVARSRAGGCVRDSHRRREPERPDAGRTDHAMGPVRPRRPRPGAEAIRRAAASGRHEDGVSPTSRPTFDELRTRQTADRDAALPRYMRQLQWSAEELRMERERRIRILLATAKARSPWHRERLRNVDAASFTEADLPSLPTMTKADLMDNFDAVVTDPRLTRDVVDAYVERLPENPYLFDRYLIIASGGSSGRRGVFVYDWDGFVTFNCQNARWRGNELANPASAVS